MLGTVLLELGVQIVNFRCAPFPSTARSGRDPLVIFRLVSLPIQEHHDDRFRQAGCAQSADFSARGAGLPEASTGRLAAPQPTDPEPLDGVPQGFQATLALGGMEGLG